MSNPTAVDLQRYATDPMSFFADLILPVSGHPRLGDVMADFQREAFAALSPTLLAITTGRTPPIDKFWLERTKGASKDGDIAACLLWLLAFSPRPIECRAGASDFDQVNELRKSLRGLLRVNDWLTGRIVVQNTRIINTITESSLDFLTSDATGSHGSRPDVTVLNELSHGVDLEFASTLCDDADKLANSVVIMATNAGHIDTWQHKWRESIRQQAETDPHVFFQRVDQPAPWISTAKLASAKSRNSDSRFRRLWGGVWTTGGGDAIDERDIERAITLPGPILEREANYIYGAGLDLGVRRDRCGLAVVGLIPGLGKVRVCNTRSWEPNGGDIDLRAVRAEILALHETYHFEMVAYDPFQAHLLSQDLAAEGVRMVEMQFTGGNLSTMARDLLTVFRDSKIELYDDEQLLGDLKTLSISERPGGFGYKLTAPSNAAGHADTAIALACILPAALKAAMEIPRNESTDIFLEQIYF